MPSGGHRHWQQALHTDWPVHLKNATFTVMHQKTTARIEATHSLLPRKPNRLICCSRSGKKVSRKSFLYALTPSLEESGYHPAPATTKYLNLSNKTSAKPRATTKGKDSRRTGSCVTTPSMTSRDDVRFHCVWELVEPSAFGVLLPAGHESKIRRSVGFPSR
jgi:hypothetical protein